MTASEVRVLFLFIDGTTEAPRDVCMAATARAPKDELVLSAVQAGKAQQTPWSSPPTCLGHLYQGGPCLPSSPLLPREAVRHWECRVSASFYSISVLIHYVASGPSLRVRAAECPVSCPLPRPLLASPCTASSFISQLLCSFSPCCPRHHQWSGRTMTPLCGRRLRFPCKSPDLLRTKDDHD